MTNTEQSGSRLCTADAETLRSAQCDDAEIKAHLFMHARGQCPTYGDDRVYEEYGRLVMAFGTGSRSMSQNDIAPEMAPNQHDEAVNVESTRVMLVSMLDHWEKAGCDCCAPSILDEAIEKIGTNPELWDRMRKFAIELATAAQWQIDYWGEDEG